MIDGINAPDASLFKVNERPREYNATFTVTGTMTVTLLADSPEDARRQASEMTLGNYFDMDFDSVETVKIDYIRKAPRMYLVTDANGQKCQKSFLGPGDTPREPDERGF